LALKWLSGNTDSATLYGIDITIPEDRQTEITWDTPYIMGLNMLDVYLNGVFLQRGTFQEQTPYSILYLDTSRPLEKDDVISIRYRPTNVNLGNIRVVPTYAQLLAVVNPIFNEIAVVTSSKTFYIYKDSGWESFVIPFTSQNIGILFQSEVILVTDIMQVSYNLTNITYQPGMQNLLVFIDGKKIDPADYTEIDSNTIIFNDPLPIGSAEIEFLVADTDSWEDNFSHIVDYIYDSQGNIREEIISMNASVVRETTYDYDNTGNISRETVVKGSKTIIKDYQYDSVGNIEKVTVTIVK
jgi:hypothetical protein